MFQQFMKYLLEPIANEIGWEDSGTHLQKLLRSDVLASAVLCEVEPVTTEARNKFHKWMHEGARISPNLREVVYTAGIKYGGVKEWLYCWARYNFTRVPSERKLLLKVLGAASDPWILQRYLLSTLNRDMIKPQDVKTVLGVVAANPDGQLQAWRHLKARWGSLQSLFGNGTFTMGGLITAVTSHFASEYVFKEVSDFFRPMDVGSGTRALQQSMEMIQLNVHWVKENEESLFNWLANNNFSQ